MPECEQVCFANRGPAAWGNLSEGLQREQTCSSLEYLAPAEYARKIKKLEPA